MKTIRVYEIKYDPVNKPGISNLIQIYSGITGLSIKEIEDKYRNENNKSTVQMADS